MATRANRAATASQLKGGKKKTRNKSIRLMDTHKSLDSNQNQEAFRINREETVARMHNGTTGERTDANAFAMPEGSDYSPRRKPRADRLEEVPMPGLFSLQCPTINRKGELSPRNTVEGERFSPQLIWSGAPKAADEFALICEDLDAEVDGKPVVRWLVYRIPPLLTELPEGIGEGDQIKSVVGTPLQGDNSLGVRGYSPPDLDRYDSWHHYRFRLIALKPALKNLRPGMTYEELLNAMSGHVLEETQLVARYRRSDFKGAA